jgi:class 3 adenylate cyclase/tetratricopeptide (TPR) repeat protein
MKCPNCGTQNREDAKFCSNCGTSLAAKCHNCSFKLAPDAKFCPNCGHPVGMQVPTSPATTLPAPVTTPEASDSLGRLQQYVPKEMLSKLEAAKANRSMAGERRIVTVLFCDVKGSTSLAEMLDPEEWAAIMNGAFKHLIEPVYRYEGTLARLMGDAILAFFGAPIAHEDDPQRAVLAGLGIVEGMKEYREHIKRQYSFDLNVRVGINTGLVVVGEVGSDLRVEYTAMGDAVNLASRMEQSAEPDTVRISGNTYKSVANLFQFKPLGEIEVRGKAEPVAAYEVLGVREGAVPERGIEGLSSTLVGRARELAALRSALEDVAAGLGRVVSVVGEAGLGKSRLVAELKRTTEAAAVAWHEGRSLSYETTTPYAPFAHLFGTMFGLDSGESDAEQYAKVLAGVEDVMGGQGEALAPFIATLLGIKLEGDAHERMRYLEPPMLRGRIFHAVISLVGALAARQPLVLAFEDVHWVDLTSLELIESLLQLTGSAPLMLLGIFRPNKQDSSWRLHEAGVRDYSDRYVTVMLQPLDEGESRQLVGNLLEIEDLPEKVRALILRKAEGNPFFVEEVIRTLLDAKLVVREGEHWRAAREIENIAVPDTLAGVITARLDRLDDASRYVAQTASVVGREFGFDVLNEVHDTPGSLDGALADLQQRELVREKSRLPTRSYSFKHVLTQETAYASLLLSRRRELHSRVARAVERTEPDRVNEIARHFVEAKEDALALPYLLESADSAAASGARDEAIGYYRQAIEIARTLDERAPLRRAYEGLGKTLEFAMKPGEAIEAYKTMLSFAEEHDDMAMQISALNKMSYTYAFILGQLPEAKEYLARAEALARDNEELGGLVEAVMVQCGVCSFTGDFDGAAKRLEEAAQLGRTLEDLGTTAYGLTHRSQMLTHLARFDEAYEVAVEGLKVAEQAKNLERRSEILTYTVPFYHLHMGNLPQAYRFAKEGYTIAARIGAGVPAIVGSYILGFIKDIQGDYDEALAWHHEGLEHARPLADFLPFLEVLPLGGLGTVCLDISEKLRDRVAEYHTEALALLKTPMGAPGGGTGWADLGYCAYALGQVQTAYEYFKQGLTLPSTEMYVQRPRLLAGAALAAQSLGLEEEARTYMEEAHSYTEERGFKFFEPLVHLVDGHVSAMKHENESAVEHYGRAEALAEQMGMRPILWQARLGRATVLHGQGEQAAAQADVEGAERAVSEIAGEFTSEEHRQAYQESMAAKIGAVA